MKDVNNEGIWSIYSGDFNQDGVMDVSDFNILEPGWHGSILTGYVVQDVSGDAVVDGSDLIVLQFVFYQIFYTHKP